MRLHTIERAQQTTAEVARFMYLLRLVTANFVEFCARGRLIVSGDSARTPRYMVASERLFRLGTVTV